MDRWSGQASLASGKCSSAGCNAGKLDKLTAGYVHGAVTVIYDLDCLGELMFYRGKQFNKGINYLILPILSWDQDLGCGVLVNLIVEQFSDLMR